MEQTRKDWCLGHDVPVQIHLRDGEIREGTVTALDPRKSKGPYQQPRGLFLTGATIGREIIDTVTTPNGQNVRPHIKQSFGGGM